MKIRCLAAACVTLAFGMAGPAGAQTRHGDQTMGGQDSGIVIQSAWARASVGRSGAAYVTVANTGSTDDRLIGVAADVAERVDIHTTAMDGNVMRMRKVDGMPLPAGGTVTFRPGGYHVMMTGLTHGLREGGQFPLTLVFEKAGRMTVTVNILKMGAMGPGMSHGGMKR